MIIRRSRKVDQARRTCERANLAAPSWARSPRRGQGWELQVGPARQEFASPSRPGRCRPQGPGEKRSHRGGAPRRDPPAPPGVREREGRRGRTGTAQNLVCERSLYPFPPALCSGPGTERKQRIRPRENGFCFRVDWVPGRVTLHQGRELGIARGPVRSPALQAPCPQVVEPGG
ncbi:unnamed protein product [Rangifer tarandus platyrhynchus]|uniref:Uncharacterized protein n=2 Tax=Rangifer tarandus platyrhynchus TaxID=3082113 RepID=A0ABN8ZHW4_RANTA|nr:unnamed protein product [Rangifer tarandus platyrhynchus]CAI9708736.1 unnamed protein product [Rangifer tarandus platyrhynchus]